MKEKKIEQPYETYERLKKELNEVNETLDVLTSITNDRFKITYSVIMPIIPFRKSLYLNDTTWSEIIKLFVLKKKEIEKELNNFLTNKKGS